MSAQSRNTLHLLYFVGFIFALHVSIPYFISSSYLNFILKDSISETRVEQLVSIVYVLAAIVTLFLFVKAPKFLSKFGNYRTIMTFSILNFLSLFSLAFITNPYLSVLSFVVFSATGFLISYCADVFLEHNSTVEETGVIRTLYLSCINIAWLFGPMIAGIILGESNYRKVFLLSSLLMLPVIYLLHTHIKRMSDPNYSRFNFWQTIREIRRDKNIEEILICNFLLQFFYVWMVIYSPIYLHIYVGFSWPEIGKIFTIMLLPFILIQYPIGYLADKRLGEKSMLTIGFIIMGLSTFSIPFFADTSFIFWAILLLITRIGAAMVEAMNDIYFFKNISEKDANLISMYRTMAPLSYVIAPIAGIIFLQFFPLGKMFFILGVLVLCGLRYSMTLKDTKITK